MIRVVLEAPVLTQSGYGEHSRLVFRALETVSGVEVHTNPLNWGQTSWSDSFPTDIADRIEASVRRFKINYEHHRKINKKMQYDVQIHVGILNEFEKKAHYSICVTAGIETDRVSWPWLKSTWKGVDRIIVPSEHARKGFVETAYQIPQANNNVVDIGKSPETSVHVVPYPIKQLDSAPLEFETTTDFNFLSVALMGPRKNIENMIRWFIEEFKDENVGLILKTGMSKGSTADRYKTTELLKKVLKPYEDRKCKVYLLHGDLSEQEVQSLYHRDDVHAYINIAHGEGFGLPIFEAAYSGLPVIATDWSGHLDFLSAPYKEAGKTKIKKLFAKVDYDLETVPKQVVWKDVITEDSRWAIPKESSYKKQIRKVFQQYGMYKKWAKALQQNIAKEYTEDKVMRMMRFAMFGEGYENKVLSEQDKIWQKDNSTIKVL